MNKENCRGCEDDFYNHRAQPGFDGATECWCFKTAKLILRKEVSINHVPPWTQKAELLPSCFHKKRYVYVAPEREF